MQKKELKQKELDEERIQITVKIKKSMHDDLEKMAQKLGISKTQLVVNLIDTGLDDVRILDKLGINDLVMIGGRIARKMKEKFYLGEANIENGELKIKVK
jgi:hypothetical protein